MCSQTRVIRRLSTQETELQTIGNAARAQHFFAKFRFQFLKMFVPDPADCLLVSVETKNDEADVGRRAHPQLLPVCDRSNCRSDYAYAAHLRNCDQILGNAAIRREHV